MALFEFSPNEALKDLVRTYRIVDFLFDSSAEIPYKPYPPKPEHCITFYPKDTERVNYVSSNREYDHLKSVIFGQQTEVSHRYVGRDFLGFQIVFQPGGLYRFLNIPLTELIDSYLDAELIFGRKVDEINEQLYEAANYMAMVTVIETFLCRQIKKKSTSVHPVDIVTQRLFLEEDIRTVDQLAAFSCLSTRQFDRIFIQRMGISPKYFHNLIRFENAFRMKNKLPHLDWGTIAIHCGYYDYQHLSKAYQKFTQQKPNDFHLLDMNAPERKFGVADTY